MDKSCQISLHWEPKPVGTFHLETRAWRFGRFSSSNVCSNSSAAVWVRPLEIGGAGPPGRSREFPPLSPSLTLCLSLLCGALSLPGLLLPASPLRAAVSLRLAGSLQGVGFYF